MTRPIPISLSASETELAALEAELPSVCGARPVHLLSTLAWHLRQRDTSRALALVQEAEASPLMQQLGGAQADALRARMALTVAEAQWLLGNLQAAHAQLAMAMAPFQSAHDAHGQADAHWLLCTLANGRGKPEEADGHLVQALACLEHCNDRVRLQATLLRRVVDTAVHDVALARRRLDDHLQHWSRPEHPAAATWWEAAHGMVLSQEGSVGTCVAHAIAVQELAQASGQMHMALIWTSNVGIYFENLQDMAAAMTWHDRAMALGRRMAGKNMLSLVQCRAASAMCDMGKPEEGLHMLQEALPHLPEGGRQQAMGWLHMGEALHALGRGAEAMPWLEKAAQRFRDSGAFMDVTVALSRQTLCATDVGDLDQAERCNWEAMCVADTHDLRAVQCWLHLEAAMVGLARRDSAAGDPIPAKQVLHDLCEALRIARSIQGFNVPPKLLDLLAAEHAWLGDTGEAYKVSLEAAKAREVAQGQEAANRTAALQVQHETERHKLEADHLRELHRMQAMRTEVLTRANTTLETLSEVGRSLTASLDSGEIFSALNQFNSQLLDAHSVVISLLDAEQSQLRMAFGIEGGKLIDPFVVALDHPHSKMARCARQRQEIVINADTETELTLPGTAATQSMMFGPLIIGERLIGVMTVQSLHTHAYAEREVAIFRTLCAYGAIALANAAAQAKVLAQNRELELLATVDTLTGLYNRRYLNQVLAREVALVERHGGNFSLILLDVDHFKRVNDQFGHHHGDLVLTGVGDILKGRVRASDTAGRWGGEEFLVLCPGTSPAEAAVVAESLRQAIAAHAFAAVGPCTASFGVACYRPGDSTRQLEQRADQAMYQAKTSGRNRVVWEVELE